jgi:hypothetical protein
VKVVIFGVGALGSHAAVLCRSLPIRLAFVDFDRVESKNLLAQAHVRPSVGRNKAEALRLQLLNLHGVEADAFPVRLEQTNVSALGSGARLLVDCLDNARGRRVLSDHARATGTPLVHAAISADGTFGLVRWEERFTADVEDQEGQATCEGGEHLPFIGLVAAALTRTIQEFISNGCKRDLMLASSGVTTTWLDRPV